MVGKSLPGHGVPKFPGQIWAQTPQARKPQGFLPFYREENCSWRHPGLGGFGITEITVENNTGARLG